MAVCEPRREASEDTKPADALTSDVQAPDCEKISVPPSLWDFVMATLAN